MPQRPLLLRLTSLWLALLILAASVGLTVQQHTCHVSGRTQRAVVLVPRHGCAPSGMAAAATQAGCRRPAAPKKAAVKDGCCAFSAHHHKVDASAHEVSSGKVPMPALLAVLPTAPMWPTALLTPVASAQQVLHAADASPPPRAGRTLLAFVCTLIV